MDCINIKDAQIKLKRLSDNEIRYYCGNQELFVKKEIAADDTNHKNFSGESHIGFSNQNFKNAKVKLFLFVS